jgi:hypothetical protein
LIRGEFQVISLNKKAAILQRSIAAFVALSYIFLFNNGEMGKTRFLNENWKSLPFLIALIYSEKSTLVKKKIALPGQRALYDKRYKAG